MNAPISVRPARARAEAQKKKKKEARQASAAQKLEVSAAVARALARGRTPFVDRLAAALETSADLDGELQPWGRVRAAIERLPDAARPRARAFVVEVEARSPGLCLVPLGHRNDRLGRAVAHMASIEHKLLRPLSTWTPRARSPRRRWDELVAHTCCAFPQPRLLEACFLEPELAPSERAAAPFVGLGGSWRAAGLPCTITRATAHLLSTTKARFRRLSNAVRLAQAESVGVSSLHRRALVKAVPSWGFDAAREPRWLDLFGWLGRHPELAASDIEIIVDALEDDDAFSTRGRTARSLVAWAKEEKRRRELREKGRLDVGPLPRSDIAGGAYVLLKEKDAAARRFSIEQIVDGQALVEEGLAMKHCVGTYAPAAKDGTTAIFSLKVERFDARPRRSLTIEVSLQARSVEQVRGKANRAVDVDERAIIACWANERGLAIDGCAF